MTPKLSVIAPAFDQQACIGRFVFELCDVLDRWGGGYELIVVDDGSRDATPVVLKALRAQFPALRVLVLDRNQGQSAALGAGIAASRGAMVALTGCDLQNDPADIPAMVGHLEGERGPDCVVGVRAHRRDTWLRRLLSRIASAIAARITGHRFRDGTCGLAVCRGDLLRRIPFFRGAQTFLATLVAMEGARVLEVDVNLRSPTATNADHGSALGRTLMALRDALGVRWLADRRVRAVARELS